MSTQRQVIRYEDAASLETVTGWVCKTCGTYHGSSPSAERSARWCCCTDLPCEQCGGRNTEKSWACCARCRQQNEDERWASLPKVEWDGETPLCEWRGDRWFWGPSDLEDWLEGGEETEPRRLEDLRLVLGEPETLPTFEVADFLSDYLGEHDLGNPAWVRELEEHVERSLKECAPAMWTQTNQAVSAESLRAWVKGE